MYFMLTMKIMQQYKNNTLTSFWETRFSLLFYSKAQFSSGSEIQKICNIGFKFHPESKFLIHCIFFLPAG